MCSIRVHRRVIVVLKEKQQYVQYQSPQKSDVVLKEEAAAQYVQIRVHRRVIVVLKEEAAAQYVQYQSPQKSDSCSKRRSSGTICAVSESTEEW